MRYVIIDYMHLAHRCFQAQPLSAMVNFGGELRPVDTTIPTHTIKNIFRYSGRGDYYTAVCFEGGNAFRKNYFSIGGDQDGSGYKGNRASHRGTFYEGVDLALTIMNTANMSLYRIANYEADDMVYSLVKKIKSFDTTTPIDVVTNDSDLLPLVDDQVSVYMRGTREFAEPGCPILRLYYQVTPRSWDEYLSYTSAYKNYRIPYNSMLLFKLIRGDKADNIAGACKGFGGKKYTEFMEKMEEDGVDFAHIFRYGNDFDSTMAPVLLNYFSEEEVARMKFIYGGICLRETSVVAPKQLDEGKLQYELSKFNINLFKA